MADWQFFNARGRGGPHKSPTLAFLAAGLFFTSGGLLSYALLRGRSVIGAVVIVSLYLALTLMWIAIGVRWRRGQRAGQR